MLAVILLLAAPKSEPYVEKLPGSTIEFKMMPVPGGKVVIGRQTVEVKPFFMAATEAPWEVYDAFLLSGEPSKPYDQTEFGPDAIARPSRSYNLPDLGWGHQGFPVINISPTNAEMFCRWLSSVTKKKYRLPTEAEWEWAAREGVDGPWKPLTTDEVKAREWSAINGTETSNPVAKRAPNKFGLYDILGNVAEWALDAKGKPVLCGGDFSTEASAMAPTLRRTYSPAWQERDPQLPKSRWWFSDGWFCGFRVVCESP